MYVRNLGYQNTNVYVRNLAGQKTSLYIYETSAIRRHMRSAFRKPRQAHRAGGGGRVGVVIAWLTVRMFAHSPGEAVIWLRSCSSMATILITPLAAARSVNSHSVASPPAAQRPLPSVHVIMIALIRQHDQSKECAWAGRLGDNTSY